MNGIVRKVCLKKSVKQITLRETVLVSLILIPAFTPFLSRFSCCNGVSSISYSVIFPTSLLVERCYNLCNKFSFSGFKPSSQVCLGRSFCNRSHIPTFFFQLLLFNKQTFSHHIIHWHFINRLVNRDKTKDKNVCNS